MDVSRWQGNIVALLAEGVDRNCPACLAKRSAEVALLAEGVDRNIQKNEIGKISVRSLSSRRAWIEMQPRLWPPEPKLVALLAEGVDRNSRPDVGPLREYGRSPRGGRG